MKHDIILLFKAGNPGPGHEAQDYTVKTDVLVVGAGFAGASAAFHLSQSFTGSILIIDKEEVPGFHASGRNASLVLQSTEIPEIRRTIAASRQCYARHREVVGFHPCGSLLLGRMEQLEKVHQPDLIPSELKAPQEVREQIPLLEGHRFEAALWTPGDGVIDVSALLQFYLQQAGSRGASLLLNCELQKLERVKGSYRAETSRGPIETRYLLNAAGAWASRVAEMAGAAALPLSPLKRHLFVLGGMPAPHPDWPFVWNLDQNFYFRPESGDLLFSLCDEEATESLEPSVNPEILEYLAELIWHQLPGLREAHQKRVWSCFRTKSPDGRFVIGWDPLLENFFWISALGGHGVGSSWELGRLAADRFLNRNTEVADPFSPARLLPAAAHRPLSD